MLATIRRVDASVTDFAAATRIASVSIPIGKVATLKRWSPAANHPSPRGSATPSCSRHSPKFAASRSVWKPIRS